MTAYLRPVDPDCQFWSLSFGISVDLISGLIREFALSEGYYCTKREQRFMLQFQ